MSSDNSNVEGDTSSCQADLTSCCASCGIAEGDNVKLRKCNGCYLVRYCGVECQKDHRPQHKRACKKRAAELRDELLFKQPESTHRGDCPICMIPLPLDETKSVLANCCSKIICRGCKYAHQKRQYEQGIVQSCPFCRHPLPKSSAEGEKLQLLMKRVAMNDPVALREFAQKHLFKGDYNGAYEYWTKAAKLGDELSHYQLSCVYGAGLEGIEKDEGKMMYHLEEAAIGGHPEARHNLARHEVIIGNTERRLKHFIIAAKLGLDVSLRDLKFAFKDGLISKEDFAAILRAHQAAVDATKSPQREAAEKYFASEDS